MKKIIIAAAVFTATFTSSDAQQSCCAKPKAYGMAIFASNKSFHDAHLSPEPLHYVAESGKMITFKTAAGPDGNAFAVKAEKPTKNVIIMVHEWWGLNDYIKREAESLQKELGNADVYAIDLYDGKVGTNSGEAGKLMQELKPERAATIINGLLASLGKDVKIGTIGWCMGGSWSFQAALLAGTKTKACVMYYGFPEKDKEKMKTLASEVLFIQANQDSYITKDAVTQFTNDLTSLGKKVTVKGYDADHAFANPSNPKYSKEFADDARKLAVDFLKKGLGI